MKMERHLMKCFRYRRAYQFFLCSRYNRRRCTIEWPSNRQQLHIDESDGHFPLSDWLSLSKSMIYVPREPFFLCLFFACSWHVLQLYDAPKVPSISFRFRRVQQRFQLSDDQFNLLRTDLAVWRIFFSSFFLILYNTHI